MALRLTQPLTERSKRNISCGVNDEGAYGWKPYHLHVQNDLKSGGSNYLNPKVISKPVMGLLLCQNTIFYCFQLSGEVDWWWKVPLTFVITSHRSVRLFVRPLASARPPPPVPISVKFLIGDVHKYLKRKSGLFGNQKISGTLYGNLGMFCFFSIKLNRYKTRFFEWNGVELED